MGSADSHTFEPTRADLLAEMRAQNINIFPLKPRSKIPMDTWKQFQSQKFEGDIPPENNYAVVCGSISENLVVFDFDNCDDEKVLDAVTEDAMKNTLVVKTSRGYHVYVKLDREMKNTKLERGTIMIDCQSSGKYVVGPTSIHPSGDEYKVVSGTLIIKRIFGVEVMERLLNAKFNPPNDSTNPVTGAEIAKGGVRYGSLHDSFLKYCNFLILTQEIRDRHTYDKLTEDWNKEGVNEFVINKEDFKRTRDDAWNFAYHKLAAKEAGQDVDLDKKKQKPHYYAIQIADAVTFKTMRDTEEILYYEGGVYHLGGESKVKEMCRSMIPECTNQDVREVMGHIQQTTFVNRTDFDSDPYKMCMENLILDINTGETLEHSPTLLFRNLLPITYNPKILPVEVPKFLRECHLDPHVIAKLLEEAAYVLLREPLFHVAFMYTGVGSNGKSVWLDWLKKFYGKENCSEISLHDLAYSRFKAAELDGKMMNIYADIKSDALKENEIIKPLIAGDAMTVEKKNQHPFTLESYAKLFFSANRIPEIMDESEGMYRRLSLTRWDVVFTGFTRDVRKIKLMDTADERSGMFNIFYRTLQRLLKRGRWTYEMSGQERKDTWKVTADPVIEYVDKFIVRSDKHSISYNELYKHFHDYQENYGRKEVDQKLFTRKILQLTGATRSTTRTSGYQENSFSGITLRSKLKEVSQQSLD